MELKRQASICYFCGSVEHTFYDEENGYSLVKCRHCGLLFLEDRPHDEVIIQSHRTGKHKGKKEIDVTGSYDPSKVEFFSDVLEDIYGDTIPESIETWLDVGCGHGEFLKAIQRFSAGTVSVTGIEPNVHKRASAVQRGIKVDFGAIESCHEKFDAVSLLNVYSHLPDPPTFLKAIKDLMNSPGELILQSGDTADFSARDHYKPYYLPDHLSFASEKIIVGILKQLGFEIISINKYPLMRYNPKIIVKELAKVFLPRYRSGLRYYLHPKKYARTDMFVRARVG